MAAPMLTQMKKESSTHLDLHCEKVDPDMNPNHLLARLVAATTVKQQLILWVFCYINNIFFLICLPT